MNNERDPRSGQVPLPGATRPAPADGWVPLPDLGRSTPEGRARQARDQGLRRVRRISNWTAAALVVGTGAAAITLAHNAVPITPPAFPGSATSGTTQTGTTAVTHGASGPQVGHSVATTSASGVTTTTTTLPNGKTVVAHSGHATYHDD